MLVQLRNGLRISEAVKAERDFVKQRRVVIGVLVLTKKPEKRIAVMPRELTPYDLQP